MQRSAELRDVYVQLFQASLNRDIGAIERGVSRSPRVTMIGTDPDEWTEGYGTIIEEFRQLFADRQQEAGVTFVPGDAEAYREGSVGWVVDRPTLRWNDGRSVECRVTRIFRQEDGQWKLVHSHISLGVPNDEVEAFRS